MAYSANTCVSVVFKIYVELTGGSGCRGSILLLVCMVWGRGFTNSILFTI